MSKIIDHKTVTSNVAGDDGETRQVEHLSHVTFEDVNGAVHTLTFHPPGTDIAGEAEDSPRIVGDDVPAFLFTDAREAVTAYERGEIA